MIQRDYKADLKTAHEEIFKMERELIKRKATARELNDELEIMRKDRDYWQAFSAQTRRNG